MLEKTKKLLLMGTVITVWVEHEQAEELLNKVEDQLKDYEARFSSHNPDSQLMTLNKQSGLSSVILDSDLFDLIKIGIEHSESEQSGLNIAMDPLIKQWRIGFSDAKIPEEKNIEKALGLTDIKNVVFEDSTNEIFLTQKGMSLDLGALAKGYFADKIIQFMISQGATSGYIDLGGNVLTFGEAPTHSDGFWRVGIQNPFLPRGNHVMVLKIKNKSVVTSGIYERVLRKGDSTFHHIFDKKTGYPVETDIASITIISSKSIDGEIWTTKLFSKDSKEGIKELTKQKDLEGIIITKTGEMMYSDSLREILIKT